MDAKLTLFRFQVPMLSAFEHAAAARDRTDNVVCALTLSDRVKGYGEAVPRAYVTGETVELCWSLLRDAAPRLPRLPEVGSGAEALAAARAWVAQLADLPNVVANATRCALELALLDALFRRLGEPMVPHLAKLAGHAKAPARPNLGYSLVAGKGVLADPARLRALAAQYGYTAVKAKVGFGLAKDLEHLHRVREVLGPEADLRVDANRALTYPQAAELMRALAPLGVKAIEDPLAGDTVAAMGEALRRLRGETGCEVVLDEPVRTVEEAQAAIAAQAVDVVNVRLSKCGGLLRGLDIAAACAAAGVGVQLGCQVGESAILSAAGRRFAEAVGNLRWLEGSNERLKYAKEHDLAVEELMYGPDAIGPALPGPGLGVTVREDRLAALSGAREELALP